MREQSLQERMQALPILEPYLRDELLALGLEERDARICALERMGETELRRVNNLARSGGELARVKATGVGKAPNASEGKKRKRAGAKNKPRKRPSRNTRGRGDDEDSAEETEDDDANDTGGEEGSSMREEPPRTRRRGRMEEEAAGEGTPTNPEVTANTTTAATANAAAAATRNEITAGVVAASMAAVEGVKAPKWAKEVRSALLEGEVGKEPAWKACAELWWALEESTKFVSPVSFFPK
jgi:hypothetical protein